MAERKGILVATIGAAVLVGTVVVGAAFIGPQLASRDGATASPTPTPIETARASPSPTPMATPTPTRRLLFTPTPLPTSRPATGLVVHENPILGYRITLPDGRRRSSASIVAGSDNEFLGFDMYTARSEAEDREACLSDAGGHLRLDGEPDLVVRASRNIAGESAEAWVTTPRSPGAQPMSTQMLVEPTMVDGREAVRLVRDQAQNHETTAYVIRANDRMYTLRFESDSIPSRAPGFLDHVATSFRVVQSLPFPTATPPPSVAPRDAARDFGQHLSRAFAARDVDAIADLITPRCWISTWPWTPPGVGVDGSSRAVVRLLAALRESFAQGDIAVVVDPEAQVHVDGTGAFRSEQFYVRSDWTASGVATRIDLFLRDTDGTFHWVAARHYEAQAAPCSVLRVIFGEGSGVGRC